ncbi:unnamed protein product [Trichobilharzia szidati]|nr:unnamed protein product [Trichobilharzia szidati]
MNILNMLLFVSIGIIYTTRFSETAIASNARSYNPWSAGSILPVSYPDSEIQQYSPTGQNQQTVFPLTSQTDLIDQYSLLRLSLPVQQLFLQSLMNPNFYNQQQQPFMFNPPTLPSQTTILYPDDQKLPSAALSGVSEDEIEIPPGINVLNPQYSDASIVGGPDDGVIGIDGGIVGSPQDIAVVESAGQMLKTGDTPQTEYAYPGTVPVNPRLYSSLTNTFQYPFQSMPFAEDQYGQPPYRQVSRKTIPSQYSDIFITNNM